MAREKILVLEDEPDVLDLCKKILASQGYQVKGAGDGYEAIERAKDEPFDLLLADIKMPGMNGMEAYQAIKGFNPDIVGVIITGYASIETAIEAVKLGFEGFVTKPFTPHELNAAVTKALDRISLERENTRLRALIPLFELSEAFMTTIDLNELLDQVVHTAQRETSADRVSLMLLDEATGELTIEAAMGLDVSVLAEAKEKAGEGIAGWVAKRGEPLLLDDKASLDPQIREAMKSDEVSSALCVPLKVKEHRVIGVLNLSKLGGIPFAGTDLELVSILCGQAAIAIENARLYGEEKRRASQLALINEVGDKAASILDLDRLMQEMTHSIQEKFNYYNVALFLLDEERREVMMQAVAGGFKHMAPGEYHQALDEGIIGFVARTGTSWLANDVSKDPHYVKGFLGEVLTKSELCVPIRLGNEVIGALDVQSIHLSDFDQADVAAMEAVADRVAIAIENARLYDEAKRRAEEMAALHRIGLITTSTLDLDEVLKIIYQQVSQLMKPDTFYMALYDEQREEINFEMYVEKGQNLGKFSRKIEEGGLTAWIIQSNQPLLIRNTAQESFPTEPLVVGEFALELSYLGVPLMTRGKVIGVMSVQSFQPYLFGEVDQRFLSAIANEAAIAIENARLFEQAQQEIAERKQAEEDLRQSYLKLQKTLGGTIHTLVSAIEMRDPYTAGHQLRVAQLACAIAKEMGLSEEKIEGIHMAGLVHDIGKMNIPAEILSKPGQLSDLEFGLIKTHSQVGHDVLNGAIEFPWPVAQIVLQHHERMDGSGYPAGLSGEEIILEARILAVADVVEAMASHRPYRPPRGIDKALEEISQNKGVLYDPEAVDACLKLFIEKGLTFE